MEKHQFKPFDKVLVRDSNFGLWRANFYSHRDSNGNYVCIFGIWSYCIPHNEQTAHLIGTDKSYKEPEPKVWHVINCNNNIKSWNFTDDELKEFIKTEVINNKNATNFHINYMK